MKKYPIWKSWSLFTDKEKKEFMEDLLDCYLDNTNEDIDTYNQDKFEGYCEDYVLNCYYDDFGRLGNVSYSPLANVEVEVQGKLGLWYGSPTIKPTRFSSLSEAIGHCLEDYNEIYEDQYGNFHVEAHHHDGINHFIIKKVIDGKVKTLNFRKEVFGC